LLVKVFYHLIANAVKYTPDGGKVTISGRVTPAFNGQLEGIEVRIQDTGIGIDPKFQELIFEKFYQTGSVALHSSGTTKFKGGGPGLGLPIARGIVLAHGGRIWVESSGHDDEKLPGSIFYVWLPIRKPD
jgi:signal transduction histidine kinase